MSLGLPEGVVRFGSSPGHHLIGAFALVFHRGFHVHLVRDGTTWEESRRARRGPPLADRASRVNVVTRRDLHEVFRAELLIAHIRRRIVSVSVKAMIPSSLRS